MKFKILMLSVLLSFAFLAIAALCADWDNQQDRSADELISGGENEIITPPEGMAATPKEQRARQKDKTSLDWTMPSTLSGGELVSPGSTRSNANSDQSTGEAAAATTNTEENSAANETNASASNGALSTAQSELPPAENTATSAGGSWSLTLNDTVQKDMALSLFQKGESVYGAGNIREGNNTSQVTASGTAKDGRMNLDVMTVGSIEVYKMALDLSGDSGSGTYQVLSAGGDSRQGSVEGLRIATE